MQGLKFPVRDTMEVGVGTAVAILTNTLSVAVQEDWVTVHLYHPVVVTLIEAVVAPVFHEYD